MARVLAHGSNPSPNTLQYRAVFCSAPTPTEEVYKRMFLAALSIVAPNWKPSRWLPTVNEQTVLHSYGILQNNEGEQTAATRHSMGECDKHNVEHKKTHTKVNKSFGFLYIKFFLKRKQH